MAEFVPLGGLAPRRAKTAYALERSLLKKVGRAIGDYSLIQAGDRIMVCVSGGKDSWALLDLLSALRRRAPISFDLLAVNVDQGWPGYRTDRIAAHLAESGVDYEMVNENFAPIVEQHIAPGDTPCSLCSRLRRGVLYNLAVRLGCTKIALGHHRDDLIETLVLNLFHSGKLASMPPILRSDDGRNTVIRPLAYVAESSLAEYAALRQFPIVQCGCPSCGLPEQQRQVVKRLLGDLEMRHPGLKDHMLAALRNVKASHLLDRTLWNETANPRAETKDSETRNF
jgi:tRNA 2-thiocytidine biosynthesis protein TtcA